MVRFSLSLDFILLCAHPKIVALLSWCDCCRWIFLSHFFHLALSECERIEWNGFAVSAISNGDWTIKTEWKNKSWSKVPSETRNNRPFSYIYKANGENRRMCALHFKSIRGWLRYAVRWAYLCLHKKIGRRLTYDFNRPSTPFHFGFSMWRTRRTCCMLSHTAITCKSFTISIHVLTYVWSDMRHIGQFYRICNESEDFFVSYFIFVLSSQRAPWETHRQRDIWFVCIIWWLEMWQ